MPTRFAFIYIYIRTYKDRDLSSVVLFVCPGTSRVRPVAFCRALLLLLGLNLLLDVLATDWSMMGHVTINDTLVDVD